MEEAVYRYKQKWWVGPMVVAAFGPCAYFFMHLAQQDRRGLIINGVIRLTPQEASWFHWALCMASAVFVLMGLGILLLSFKSPRRITLTSKGLIAPKSAISAKYIEIPYRDILALHVQEVHGQRFLRIEHARGNVSIVGSMLAAPAELDELSHVLAARVDHGRRFSQP